MARLGTLEEDLTLLSPPFCISQKEFVEENRTDNVNNAFVANLYLMEIERVKYILRSYLKARLAKVTAQFSL